MEGIYLTSDEMDALHGAGPLAACLYVWLRSWMDLRTGQVGVTRTISLAMLATYAESHVPKGGGSQILKPSERNVRTALGALSRAGLLRRTRADLLVFRLPMARLLSLGSGKPDTNPTGGSDTLPDTEPDTHPTGASASTGAGFDDSESANPTRNPTRNPTGGKPPYPTHIRGQSKPSTSQASSTAVSEGDSDQVVQFAAALVRRGGGDDTQMSPEQAQHYSALYRCLRNGGAKVSAMDRYRLQQWVGQQVTVVQLSAALQRAQRNREQEGSRQPIGLAYLEAILEDMHKPKEPPWWVSDEAMGVKARALGIDGARAGESRPDFKARIQAAILMQEGKQA